MRAEIKISAIELGSIVEDLVRKKTGRPVVSMDTRIDVKDGQGRLIEVIAVVSYDDPVVPQGPTPR